MFSLNATALVCTCDNDDDCGSGNYCDHGVDCTCPMDDPTCQYVNGRCKACRGEGYSCSSNEQCCNLFCNSGYQISGNYCCPGSQAWDGSRCCKPDTISCASNDQCCSGLYCDDGTRCCPTGTYWHGGSQTCRAALHCNNCPYVPTQWEYFTDSRCIYGGSTECCCVTGNYGDPNFKEWIDIEVY